MNPWLAKVPIFEGEDEDALKADFVKFSALYPTYSAFAVGEHVFRNLPDPYSRGQQAGAVWGKDIEILERIRTYSATESETSDTSPENQVKQLWIIANDPATESRDAVAAIKLIAEIQGNLKKAKDADDGKKQVDRPYSFKYVEKDFDKDPPSDDDTE